MYFGGCDIGSLTAKAVIYDGLNIISSAIIKVKGKPSESAKEVMKLALHDAGLALSDMDKIVGTGYGKEMIDFATSTESEITCHAKGAWAGNKEVRTVIDIGGQDAKAVKLDTEGNVTRYIYNDKCATGTGRFLEVIAAALDLRLEDLGSVEEEAQKDLILSSQCVIFAETEIVSLISKGESVAAIVKALHNSVAGRTASLAKGIGLEEKVMFTGGVAKNKGVARALAEYLGKELIVSDIDPQINGAFGAAVIAGL